MREPKEEPTIIDATGPSASTHGSTHASRFASTAVPEILHREEATRSLALVRLVAPVSALGFAAAWAPRAGVPGRGPFMLATALTFALSVILWLRLRADLSAFRISHTTLHGLLCAASVLTGAYYVGVFSPVIIAACVGIYWVGLSDSRRMAWSIFLTCAIGYFALALLALEGKIALDRAVIAIEHPDVTGLAAVAIVTEVILGLTFWMALRSREATLDAFERLEKAARAIRKREALLAEARADIDFAKGGAKLGRYTGQTVGDYDVGEMLGRGAMGEVYRARYLPTDRPAAIKLLHPMILSEPGVVERFLREAKVASAIASDHVVKILGSGTSDDGIPFIAMELLEGRDLADKLRDDRRMPANAVLDLVEQVAHALSAADEAGVVHRDVKPQNLFSTERDGKVSWKVLDFGVSKLNETASTLTRGGIIGTPSYMAPEQARGDQVDHRADVFSLGVICYRALTGRPAFTGPDSVTTIYNVLHMQPARPSENESLGEDVDRVLALALAKDRARRFASAAMFAAALRDALKRRLDDRLRQDADRLLAEQPWGMEIDAKRRSMRPRNSSKP